MLTLWDLLKEAGELLAPPQRPPAKKPPTRKPPCPAPRQPPRDSTQQHRPRPRGVARAAPTRGRGTRRPAAPTMAERYEAIARRYLAEHGIKVRKWRKGMSGIATQVRYRDGRIARSIECPRPRGPMSMAVFLHEVGHHVIGFNTYRPRCLEEYHAWRYAIEQMELLELNITDNVRKRMHNSLRYAVQKAQRRGIREVPEELRAYTAPWTGSSGA